MKKVTRSIFLFAVLVIMSAFSMTAHAEPENDSEGIKLDYRMAGNDKFNFYISESDDEVGELLLSGNVKREVVNGSTNLRPGKYYYLHIQVTGTGGEPGYIGEFKLNGKALKFENNTNSLLTNVNDFRVNRTGFGKDYSKYKILNNVYLNNLGLPIKNAIWIWSNPGGNGTVYFSTRIIPDQTELTAQASGTNNGVNITWNSIPDVISYSVERSITAGGPYNPIASDLTETSYTDNSTVANNTYYYIVKAKLSDTETITSTEVSATPTNETPTIDSKLKVVLEPEEKLQLSVDDHLDENTNMAWTSSDSTVAQVDANGVVTAIKAGDAVIHVQSPDGSYSDDINILVVDNADDYRLAVDLKIGKTTRLTVDNLTNTLNVTWESSDTTVATVSSKGVVTAKGKGLTLAKATDREGNVVGQVYVRVRD